MEDRNLQRTLMNSEHKNVRAMTPRHMMKGESLKGSQGELDGAFALGTSQGSHVWGHVFNAGENGLSACNYTASRYIFQTRS